MLAGVSQMFAQRLPLSVNQYPPAENVGWDSPASLCQVIPGSAPSHVDYVSGSVSFAPGASGTIGLFCPVTAIGNGFTPSQMDYVALTFSNPAVELGCTASAFFVDRTTGLSDGWVSSKSQEYNGLWTANVPLTGNTSPIALNHAHEVNVYLFRPQSAGERCNPVAYGMFLANVNVIF